MMTSFPSDIYFIVGLPGNMVILFLVFVQSSKLFLIVAILIYLLTNNVYNIEKF